MLLFRTAIRAALAIGLSVALLPAQGPALPERPSGYVNDYAQLLPPDRAEVLTRVIADVKAKSGGEIALVTLPDLEGREASEIALRIGREWKVGDVAELGDRRNNAGVVILIVPKETNQSGRGACRIEVGRGSEGFITDAQSGEICRAAVPYFRERAYARGIELVTLAVAQRYASEFGFALDSTLVPARPARRAAKSSSPIAALVAIFVVIMIVSALSRGGRGGGGRGGFGGPGIVVLPPIGGGGFGGGSGWSGGGGWGSGGGFGGGFGGFGGGGGFSGGGGGSDW